MNLCKTLTFEKNSGCHLLMVDLLHTTVRTPVVMFGAILPPTVHVSRILLAGEFFFIFLVNLTKYLSYSEYMLQWTWKFALILLLKLVKLNHWLSRHLLQVYCFVFPDLEKSQEVQDSIIPSKEPFKRPGKFRTLELKPSNIFWKKILCFFPYRKATCRNHSTICEAVLRVWAQFLVSRC